MAESSEVYIMKKILERYVNQKDRQAYFLVRWSDGSKTPEPLENVVQAPLFLHQLLDKCASKPGWANRKSYLPRHAVWMWDKRSFLPTGKETLTSITLLQKRSTDDYYFVKFEDIGEVFVMKVFIDYLYPVEAAKFLRVQELKEAAWNAVANKAGNN